MAESEKIGELHTFEVKVTDGVNFVQAASYELNSQGQLLFRNDENKISRVYNADYWRYVSDWHEDDNDDG